jgi:hypothetical protein
LSRLPAQFRLSRNHSHPSAVRRTRTSNRRATDKARRCRAPACSIKTRAARSFTLIRVPRGALLLTGDFGGPVATLPYSGPAAYRSRSDSGYPAYSGPPPLARQTTRATPTPWLAIPVSTPRRTGRLEPSTASLLAELRPGIHPNPRPCSLCGLPRSLIATL